MWASESSQKDNGSETIIAQQMGRIMRQVARFFPDREIFVRSNGEVRFVHISSALQLKVVGAILLALLAWLVVTGATLLMRVEVERQSAALGAKAAVVERSAGKVEAFRDSVDGIAERLEARQQRLDRIIGRYFGPVHKDGARSPTAAATVPGAARLGAIEQQQIAFARAVSAAADARSKRAEGALRRFGIAPASIVRSATEGMGGPFIPLSGGEAALLRLSETLQRLDRLERTVLSLPSVKPALPVVLSSTFGVRSDPFNHRAAMHAGLDIKDDYGQPIYAASAGRVTRIGRMAGYGNVVMIDHGHGIETRYGHLSGFTVRPGMVVKPGQQIARMGSTGRSTGNHLHFEVRVNGRAVNPRPFLEASSDVLEIQKHVGQRFAVDSRRS